MAKSEDLDNNLDGYTPEDIIYTRPSRPRTTPQAAPVAPVVPQPAPASAPQPAPQPQPTAQPQDDKQKGNSQTDHDEEESTNAFVRFFTDERLRIFLGFLFIFACVFILIAFVSHLKNGATDQSIVDNMTLSQIAENPSQIKNAAGGFGATISKMFFCDALGLGSLVFVVYFWLLGLALLGLKKCNFWSLTFRTLLVAISTSIVLGLVMMSSNSAFKWGGSYGYFINDFLFKHTTWIGAVAVSGILLVAVACVYLNELKSLWEKWQESSMRKKLKEELRKERENKVENLADPTEQPQETQEQDKPNAPVSVEITPEESAGNIPESAEAASDATAPDNSEERTAPVSELDTILEDSDIEIESADDGFRIDLTSADEKEQPDADTETGSEPVPEAKAATETTTETAATVPAGSDVEFSIRISDDSSDSASTETATNETSATETAASETEGTESVDAAAEATTTETGDSSFSITAPTIEVADEFTNTSTDDVPAKQSSFEKLGPYDHRAELSRFEFPPIDLLTERETKVAIDMQEQQANKERIVETLLHYKIPISKIEATVGPTVTLYEIVPADGVRISQIKRLEDDIALSLAALGIRIIAPIPGKGTVGIEVPNRDPQTVSMHSVITSKKYQESKMALPMAMGATISNDIFIADLAKMPHLLVAGATGMGKSVGLNAIIASLLYKKHPSELKFVLIDPKMVEFSLYSKIEYQYLAKLPAEEDSIITDPSKVIQTLNSLCIEMDDRYALLRKAGVRSIEEYNQKFTLRKLNPNDGHKYLPYIVIVVDEFADLIMTAGKEVETPIARIAQKARAVGMHMIIATQRPSTNVITGIIKANFPGRIAFRVSQMVDSKTILDRTGANQLIGRGDMLFSHNGSLERVQCAFISTEEVEKITEWIDDQVGYDHPFFLPEPPMESGDGISAGPSTDRDPLFADAARFIVNRQNGSTSILQRQFNIGYNRAGRLMDQMEAAGIVGPANGSKPRDIRVDSITLEQILSQ